ncbi:MAG: hypothetical protein O2819_03570 [Planctomycetota bacterium]|nr:hypothetical protein [Planctomycetota bacterium]MDA1105597.1 hypothetical protein [Planctomycetota bacterium]
MDLEVFLRHHRLQSNPFAGEEAAQDGVFARSGLSYRHPEYSRIRGDVAVPLTSLVFGERGAGKTALRMQVAAEYEAAAAEGEHRGTMPIVVDSFDGLLDRTGGQPTNADWIDRILSAAVPPLVDAALDEPLQGAARIPAGKLSDAMRQAGGREKRDLLVLQSIYDRVGEARERTRRLRIALRLGGRLRTGIYFWSGTILLAMGIGWLSFVERQVGGFLEAWQRLAWQGLGVAVGLAGGILLVRFLAREATLWKAAQRVSRACRAVGRGVIDLRLGFGQLRAGDLHRLPRGAALDERYELLERLLRVVRTGGWRSVAIFVDRVDEPQSVAGEAAAMKALVWPIMDHAILQFPGFAFKVFLPLEVRALAEEEGNAFHRRARLDKQSVVERLEWSGPALFDLLMARIRACTITGSPPPFLHTLFADDVTPQRIADCLARLRAPRAACRFLHEVLLEHVNSQTELTPHFQVSSATLDTVLRRWEQGGGIAYRVGSGGARPAPHA